MRQLRTKKMEIIEHGAKQYNISTLLPRREESMLPNSNKRTTLILCRDHWQPFHSIISASVHSRHGLIKLHQQTGGTCRDLINNQTINNMINMAERLKLQFKRLRRFQINSRIQPQTCLEAIHSQMSVHSRLHHLRRLTRCLRSKATKLWSEMPKLRSKAYRKTWELWS